MDLRSREVSWRLEGRDWKGVVEREAARHTDNQLSSAQLNDAMRCDSNTMPSPVPCIRHGLVGCYELDSWRNVYPCPWKNRSLHPEKYVNM